jgi:hypothetical protein
MYVEIAGGIGLYRHDWSGPLFLIAAIGTVPELYRRRPKARDNGLRAQAANERLLGS